MYNIYLKERKRFEKSTYVELIHGRKEINVVLLFTKYFPISLLGISLFFVIIFPSFVKTPQPTRHEYLPLSQEPPIFTHQIHLPHPFILLHPSILLIPFRDHNSWRLAASALIIPGCRRFCWPTLPLGGKRSTILTYGRIVSSSPLLLFMASSASSLLYAFSLFLIPFSNVFLFFFFELNWIQFWGIGFVLISSIIWLSRRLLLMVSLISLLTNSSWFQHANGLLWVFI